MRASRALVIALYLWPQRLSDNLGVISGGAAGLWWVQPDRSSLARAEALSPSSLANASLSRANWAAILSPWASVSLVAGQARLPKQLGWETLPSFWLQ